jgi:lysophospholipase L1-like esterase
MPPWRNLVVRPVAKAPWRMPRSWTVADASLPVPFLARVRVPASSRRFARPAAVLAAGVLVMLLASSCAEAATAPPASSPTPAPCPAASGDTICILVLGDSIAAGEGVAGPDRWPARLEALLREDSPGRDITVSNWAQGGSQIDLLEDRVADLPLGSYEVAIVIAGVNDAAVRSVDEWVPRYTAVIEKLEEAGVTVVIGTAPPTFEGGVFTDRFAAVAAELRALAGSRPMLDIEREWKAIGVGTVGGYYLDAVHQNSSGQAVIAERARTIVNEILRAP